MKIVTADEMRELDRKAIEDYGIPSLILMENAGRGVAEFVFKSQQGRRAVIVAGKGNNGGDGFVVARHLHNKGFQVQVFLIGEKKDLKPDALTNFEIAEKMKLSIRIIKGPEGIEALREIMDRSDVCIDAIFGVGLSRAIEGLEKEVIEILNEKKLNLIALDVPSGLHSDTGEVLGVCVKAHMTATLGVPKKGLLEDAAKEWAGRICVIDIGLPKETYEESKRD